MSYNYMAMAYGADGSKCTSNQTCMVPNTPKASYEELSKIPKEYFADTVCSSGAFSHAIVSCNWSGYKIKKEELKKDSSSIHKVYVYGVLNTGERKFLLESLFGEKAQKMQQYLSENNPSLREIEETITHTISLTSMSFPPIGKPPASFKKVGHIAFYYLPKDAKLEIKTNERRSIVAEKNATIVAYPVTPDVNEVKREQMYTIFSQYCAKNGLAFIGLDVFPKKIIQPVMTATSAP